MSSDSGDPAEPQSQRPSRFSGLVSHEPTASQKHECIERSESPCPLCERDYKKLYLEEREARERLEKEYERLKASRENCAKCEIRTYQKMIDKFYRKIQYVLQNERLSLFQRYDSCETYDVLSQSSILNFFSVPNDSRPWIQNLCRFLQLPGQSLFKCQNHKSRQVLSEIQ